MQRTNRGFAIYAHVTDNKGQQIRVQKSSDAEHRSVWIFCSKGGIDGVFHMGRWQSFSPHLSPAKARRVAQALLRFADGDE